MLTDGEGAVSDTYDYDAFGTATAEAGLTVNPYRYCGEYQDETTGLYYLRARYYDSTTGRFISADSYSGRLSDPVSLHKYLYANANPVMNSDPTGYYTLSSMSVAMSVQNIIMTTAASSIIGGLLSMADALSGGESNIITLCERYVSGAVSGALISYIICECVLTGGTGAAVIQLGLGTLFTYTASQSLTGALDSFEKGNYVQGTHLALVSILSVSGATQMYGGAYSTIFKNLSSVDNSSISQAKNSNNPSKNIINKQNTVNPEIGNKLEYVFGKASGNKHNIDRSVSMERILNSIGIFDNDFGRLYLKSEIERSFYNNGNFILQANGRIQKESILLDQAALQK